MGLIKSFGNKFIDYNINYINGECVYKCSYCYMNKYQRPEIPYLDEGELNTNLGYNNTIAVCSNCDLFADNIEDEWIDRILRHLEKFPHNRYFFQTKNPERVKSFDMSKLRCIISTTIESDQYDEKIMGSAPSPEERIKHMPKRHVVALDPLFKFDLSNMVELLKFCEPQFVNIGLDTKDSGFPEPTKEEVIALIKELETFTKVYKKESLMRLFME